MPIPTLPGITAGTISTGRITTRVLFSGPNDGIPVLFLHGNLSSATWWEEAMLALPDGYRGIAPDQRGFGDADISAKIDATRGTGDWADDAVALLDHLDIARTHLVGNSLGGSVVWRLLIDAPERFLTVTQVAPGSPYGFGGTKEVSGTPCWPDFAGSGGGLSNPELIKRIAAGDLGLESPFSLRAALRALVYKPPFVPEREEEILSSSLAIHIGPQDTPGDFMPSPNWPGIAPGVWGPANALSPKYADDPARLLDIDPKPPILWIRGSHDLAVSDAAASDPGALGAAGLLPGWPGADAYPPQPMLAQTRAVLDKYKAHGGWYDEVVIEDAAHAPFLENPQKFNVAFHAHLKR
ncbi:MAG: alpha/beta hydrolase [Caldilineales bacterium]|nr:alpha/beta hydrolase [Caldilineales bacterium]